MITENQNKTTSYKSSLKSDREKMSCPAGKMEKDENYKRMMLISAGAAMAAGCEPCINYIVPNLIELGVDDDEIKNAVTIGLHISEKKSKIMKEAADILAGTSFLENIGSETDKFEELDKFIDNKMSMLIAAGASAAAGFYLYLEYIASRIGKYEISKNEIHSAINVGLTVKSKPEAIMSNTISRLFSIDEKVDAVGCKCG